MDRNMVRTGVTVLLFIFLLAGCTKESGAQSQPSDNPVDEALVSRDPAMAMIERFNMGANLEQMAIRVAMSTVTYNIVIEKHGAAEAASVVTQEIRTLLPDYQPRWNTNLAQAYASYLSGDELRSLVVDGATSPYRNRLEAVQTSVGEDMQANSKPILTELVTKALTNVVE